MSSEACRAKNRQRMLFTIDGLIDSHNFQSVGRDVELPILTNVSLQVNLASVQRVNKAQIQKYSAK